MNGCHVPSHRYVSRAQPVRQKISGHSVPKTIPVQRARHIRRCFHLEVRRFPFVVRYSMHEGLPSRLASLRVSGAARATEISGTPFPRHFHCSARGTSGGAFTLEDRRFTFVVRLSNHERGVCRFALRPLLRLSSQMTTAPTVPSRLPLRRVSSPGTTL